MNKWNINAIQYSMALKLREVTVLDINSFINKMDKDSIKKLGQALQSQEVKQFIEDNYEGSLIPAF